MSYRAAVSLRSQSAILHPPILQMHPPPYNLISAPHLFAERFSVFTWMNPFWRTHLCFPFLCVPQFWFPQCCIRRPPLSSHSALTLFRSKSLRRCSDQFFLDTFAFFASSISNPLSVTRYCSNSFDLLSFCWLSFLFAIHPVLSPLWIDSCQISHQFQLLEIYRLILIKPITITQCPFSIVFSQ